MAKYGSESTELLHKFRLDKTSGLIVKRFKDDFIVFDILKILYDDTVDSYVKTELLVDLEEYGHLGLSSESVDQVVTSLLDIVSQHGDSTNNWTYVCQSLLTATSLLIQLDQLETDICKQLVKVLVSIVTNSNHPDNQRLRSCACHCLIHMEEFQHGLLFSYTDEFCRLARQEKSCIYQDYALLAAKVLENIGSMSLAKLNSPTGLEGETFTSRHITCSDTHLSKQVTVQKQMSYDPQDVRQFSAFLLENMGLMTRCGYFRVVQSIAEIVKTFPEVSPMVFKPLLLHQMSTVSCVLFQTIMYIQREFQGEILTEKEQSEFLHRLCIMTDHPCLTLLNKLLVSQWAKYYYLDESPAGDSYRSIIQRLRFKFYPSVFDQVDCQLSKLIMTSLCVNREDDSGLETSVLLGSLAYIHKLAWHTGSSTVAIVMFKALYYMYQRLNNASFSSDIQRFLRGLCTDLPHFIPHTIDFLDSIHDLGISSTIYVETLDLLHKQVVMATEDQIEKSYHFYLQILKKAACEKQISQVSSLQFLQSLAEKSEFITDNCWELGHRILEICRNFLLYQGTDLYYTDFDDSIQELKDQRAIVTFWEIITIVTSTISGCIVIYGLVKIFKKGLVSANHRFVYLTASLIACFVLCTLQCIGAFMNIFNNYFTKTWHLCFYFEVFKTTALEWIGVCLIITLADMLCSLIQMNNHLVGDFVSQRIFANISTVFFGVLLLVINSVVEHVFEDFPERISYCSKKSVFLNHLDFSAKIELAVKCIEVMLILVLMLCVALLVRHKYKTGILDESSEVGSKTCNELEEIGKDMDSPGSQSRGAMLHEAGKKEYSNNVSGEVNGFIGDTDILTTSKGSVSPSEIGRRFSHSTTLDTFVNLSPKPSQKLSVASIECDHVLYALENFFMIDPARVQYDRRARLSYTEHTQRLMEEETSFSRFPRRRLMSMPGMRLRMGETIDEENEKLDINDEEQEKDARSSRHDSDKYGKSRSDSVPEKHVSGHNSEEYGKRRSNSLLFKARSKSFECKVDEVEEKPQTAGTMTIEADVEVHDGHDPKTTIAHQHEYPVVDFDTWNDAIPASAFGEKRAEQFVSDCKGYSSIKKERSDAVDQWLNTKVIDMVSEHADNNLATFDRKRSDNDKLDMLCGKPEGHLHGGNRPDTLQCEKRSDCDEKDCRSGSTSTKFAKGKKRVEELVEVEETAIEKLDSDVEVSISKVSDNEPLSFKDLIKLMGQMTFNIVIISVVYIVLVLMSSCYAFMVVTERKEDLTIEKTSLFENISNLGQILFVLCYVITFEVRFGLCKNRTRK